eukprot:14411720-Alexandrium_andersonii.AAC.1
MPRLASSHHSSGTPQLGTKVVFPAHLFSFERGHLLLRRVLEEKQLLAWVFESLLATVGFGRWSLPLMRAWERSSG